MRRILRKSYPKGIDLQLNTMISLAFSLVVEPQVNLMLTCGQPRDNTGAAQPQVNTFTFTLYPALCT